MKNANTGNEFTSLKVFGLVFIILISLMLNSCSSGNIFDDKKFRFEDYDNKPVEKAAKDLLKLHPLGSDYRKLVKTLELSGCKFGDKVYQHKVPEDSEYLYEKYKSSSNSWIRFYPFNEKDRFTLLKKVCNYQYNALPRGLYVAYWGVGIFFNKENEIAGISLTTHVNP